VAAGVLEVAALAIAAEQQQQQQQQQQVCERTYAALVLCGSGCLANAAAQ
jgi:hypothetical protein